jgi:RNA polymerase sigma factor (sigma-70 family)
VLEQAVFRYRFRQGLSYNACLAALQPDFPNLDESRLQHAVQRVAGALTSRQHFLLSVNRSRTISLDDKATETGPWQVASQEADPESHAVASEESKRLHAALKELSARHRLLLQLRYEQELTLKEIARLLRLGDPFRARREIQSALAELEQIFKT